MNSKFTKLCLFVCGIVVLQGHAQAEQSTALEKEASLQGRATLSAYVDNLLQPVTYDPYWYVQASVYTRHFKKNPDHNNNQELIGLERHTAESYLVGGATFKHSYGKRSYYGYAGKRFDFDGTPFYGKLTACLLYGYKGEYRDKIPFNRFEIAPVIIPSIGVKYRRVGAEVVLLGAAATMVNIGFEL